ncbi:hypothetical protein EUTSA_v10006458mg [Eutrema salsugineum]|uniref:WRKY domain-containing protein n=1 Tax=Eutrema salsugineum TaxID=72664 RepID=V4NCW1_EUTSA|nr:probable WRKY transcription factor 68 [Eutrema salsugineum]ESQ43836.1 hypothetical protein EUTSA_v10006458mg [Eutrema salsugineum]
MENIGVGVGVPFSDLTVERYPLGFMDLLGLHQSISRYALIHPPSMQLPATPSSISSTSCEALSEDENSRDYEEEEEQHTRYKPFKLAKSRSEQKKTRVPRVSFITKSEVNNLDDGYKWRKYGQKPVRNSPFPRNYYRCTTSWCDVKKRVERSFSDPSNVITTYEGQHTHPIPHIMSKRVSFGSNGSASGAHFGLPKLPPQLHHQLFDYNNHQQQQQELSFFGTEYLNRQEKGSDHDDEDDDHDYVMKKSRTQDLLNGAGLVRDHGLLQDVVPAHIIKEEY